MGGFGEDHEVHRLDGNVLDLDATFLLGEVRERKGELDHEHHGKNRSAHEVPQARFLYRFQKVNLSTYVEGNRKIRSCENLDTATLSLQLKLSGPGHRAVRFVLSLLFNATMDDRTHRRTCWPTHGNLGPRCAVWIADRQTDRRISTKVAAAGCMSDTAGRRAGPGRPEG